MFRHLSTRNISSKSRLAFLSNLANRQTGRQTDKQTRAKTCTSYSTQLEIAVEASSVVFRCALDLTCGAAAGRCRPQSSVSPLSRRHDKSGRSTKDRTWSCSRRIDNTSPYMSWLYTEHQLRQLQQSRSASRSCLDSERPSRAEGKMEVTDGAEDVNVPCTVLCRAQNSQRWSMPPSLSARCRHRRPRHRRWKYRFSRGWHLELVVVGSIQLPRRLPTGRVFYRLSIPSTLISHQQTSTDDRRRRVIMQAKLRDVSVR